MRLIEFVSSAGVLACAMGCIAEPERSSGDPATAFGASALELPSDGEILFGDDMEIASLSLSSGTELYFLEVAPAEVGVLELRPSHVESVVTLAELGEQPAPAAIFHAFSEPGTEIPARILAAAPLPADVGAQGWARERSLQSATSSSCIDDNVRDWINGFGYNDRGTPNIRLNRTPDSSSLFVPYVENWEPGYYFWEYAPGGSYGSTYPNIDRYATYVAVCAIDSYDNRNPGNRAHPAIDIPFYSNPHMGPQVRIMYRRQNTDGQYQQASFKDFAADEVGKVLSWHFYTGSDWDWRTEIHWAGGDDQFDIAHAVEDL